jgi:undecaprenyl phosphate-alpha-L-ara4FN deformylase
MRVGLRIDVDTFRGTRDGVPALRALLRKHGLRGSFFFSVGPDNMGRHLRRLLRPRFLLKMIRSRAPGLYGFDILRRGTLWPGPRIGERLPDAIRDVERDGHEVGFHAWDHHRWQTRLDRMDRPEIDEDLERGVAALAQIIGRPPDATAAPAWKCTDEVLLSKERFPVRYHSDCRGERPFHPLVGGRRLLRPQVPVTLPTYDEAIGRTGVTDRTWNDHLLSLLREDVPEVYTIHAEVEGISRVGLFADLLDRAAARGVVFTTLGEVLEHAAPLPDCPMVRGETPGRDGWLARQGTEGPE